MELAPKTKIDLCG